MSFDLLKSRGVPMVNAATVRGDCGPVAAVEPLTDTAAAMSILVSKCHEMMDMVEGSLVGPAPCENVKPQSGSGIIDVVRTSEIRLSALANRIERLINILGAPK